MPELTLRDPLSASEMKEIILQEISKRLDQDSTLLNDLTYSGFKARFQINLSYEKSLVKETLIWGSVEEGTVGSGKIEEVVVASEYQSGSPNVERQEHDLAIPVMVSTPSGQERRRVKIERVGRKG